MSNTYETSDGRKLTQRTINSYLTNEKKGWLVKYVCECFGPGFPAHDWDHTISQKRCKELHKTELIWSEGNGSWSNRVAHGQWESYKNGKFSHHLNALQRMLFVAMHDPKTFKKRFQCITNESLKVRLQTLYDTIDEEIEF